MWFGVGCIGGMEGTAVTRRVSWMTEVTSRAELTWDSFERNVLWTSPSWDVAQRRLVDSDISRESIGLGCLEMSVSKYVPVKVGRVYTAALACNDTRDVPFGETLPVGALRDSNKQNKLRGLSPRANYTDRAAAARRRS